MNDTRKNGRKIKREYENPIDNIIIDITEKFNPIYKKLGFTPNILTTISLVSSLIGLYLYKTKNIVLGATLFFIGYCFDCADGNFARKYKMETVFGDYYDHASDSLKLILLFYVLLTLKLKKNVKLYLILITLLLNILMLIHIGCQEKYYNTNGSSNKSLKNPQSDSLKKLENYCPNKKNIYLTRWFGCGTVFFYIFMVMLFIHDINKLF